MIIAGFIQSSRYSVGFTVRVQNVHGFISVCTWHLEASESKLLSLKLRDKSFVHWYQDSHKVVSGDVSY